MFETLFTGAVLYVIAILFYRKFIQKHYFIQEINVDGFWIENVRVPFIKGVSFSSNLEHWLTSKGYAKPHSKIQYSVAKLKGWL